MPPRESDSPKIIVIRKAIDKRAAGHIAAMDFDTAEPAAAPATPAVVPSAYQLKHPHEMTFAEFHAYNGGRHRSVAALSRLQRAHKNRILEAIHRHDSVPAHVLAEYPDLLRPSLDAPHLPKPAPITMGAMKPKPVVVRLKKQQELTGSLFDEEAHPRAETESVNPKTGKTSKPGQFTEKTNAGAGGKADEDNSRSEETTAPSDGTGTDVSAEPQGAASETVPGTAGEGRTRSRRRSRAGSSGGLPLLFDFGEGAGPERGEEPGAADVHSTAEREGRAGLEPQSVLDVVDAEESALNGDADEFESGHQFSAPLKVGNDYRITDEDHLGAGSESTKFRNNLDAIHTLKAIEAQGRKATREEQAVLAKYTGWGWAGAYFDPYNEYPPSPWNKARHQKEYQELKAILTKDEFKAASASTPNAHYTSKPVIDAMWDAARRLGFTGGRVLEPALGSGNFFGLCPADLWARSTATGIELDDITARIGAQLYQSADVRHSGLEAANLPDNFFDLAISNVPFGNYPVFDAAYDNPRQRFLTKAIHNYFFAKALEKVRPGGIVAFITSHHTMDAKTAENLRAYLSDRADLMGAIRLPNDAFKENAGTEVTTDILFLRKRAPGEDRHGDSHPWTELAAVNDIEGNPTNVNEYYADHPDMMLGAMHPNAAAGRFQGYGLVSNGIDTQEGLQRAIVGLPENVMTRPEHPASQPANVAAALRAEEGMQPNSYHLVEGKVHINEDGMLTAVEKLPKKTAERIAWMIGLRDGARRLLADMADPRTADIDIHAAQSRLNRLYDDFVAAHGFLNDRANVRAFGEDPDSPLLLALEKWNPKTQTATKADIFSHRTIAPTTTSAHLSDPQAAMLYCLADSNRLDWRQMSLLTGKSPETLQQALLEAGHVFQNPEGDWETADSYLSGNVRAKLLAAQGAAQNDPRYERNVAALQAALPRDFLPEEISAKLGASWIHPEIISAFMEHLLGFDSKMKVGYIPQEAMWVVTPPSDSTKNSARSVNKWGTEDFYAHSLLSCALNQKLPTVWITEKVAGGGERRYVDRAATAAAREKLQQIKDEFSTWLWSDPKRAEVLARKYNTVHNSHRERAYNGQHLTLPGLSAVWSAPGKMKPHVKDAIWRILQSPTTLLAHCVGAGKTAEMVGAALEMRRLGLSKKPMFVVPNHLVGQWASEIRDMYPAANILMTTPEDFEAKNRRKLMAKIATGDWDAVLVAQTHFTKLPVAKETEATFYQQQIDDLRAMLNDPDVAGDKRTQKEIEKSIKRFEVKLQRRVSRKDKDDLLNFERLGVDSLFVDEAHMYKNLWFPTKMTRVAGLPNAESNRAFDMYMKTQHIQKMNNGRGVVFATGTPVSNTIAEMYTMQRYLQGPELERRGIAHFDAWAANFGDTVTTVEMSPDGRGYKPRTRFARFTNVPELSKMFGQFADVKTREDLKLPVPEVERHMVTCKPTLEQTAYIRALGKRAANILGENGEDAIPDPSDDNMLKLMSDGRKASLDIRLVDPSAPESVDGKVNRCVANIIAVHRDSADSRGAQVVFLDLSTPKAEKERADDTQEQGADNNETEDTATAEEQRLAGSVYQDIRRKLIAQGIPAEEIAFIHDARTQAEKVKLFDDMNTGKVRVLLGSTEKMGTGMNAQQKMIALHHLDCPWRPADLEQREGRIIRQGNTNPKVHIYSYATEGEDGAMSTDTYMYQTVEHKARSINQIMQGKTDQRNVDDADMVLTASEMKALSSGNPLIKEKVDVEHELAQLEVSHASHAKTQAQAQRKLALLPGQIQEKQTALAKLEKVTTYRDQNKPEKFRMTIKGNHFDDQETAGTSLMAYARSQAPGNPPQDVGEYAGFKLAVGADALGGEGVVYVGIPGQSNYLGTFGIGDSARGTIQRLNSFLRAFESQKDKLAKEIDSLSLDLHLLPDEIKPFPKAMRLQELTTRLKEINQKLGIGKSENVYDEAPDSDDITEHEQTPSSRRPVIVMPSPSRTQDVPVVSPPPAQSASAAIAPVQSATQENPVATTPPATTEPPKQHKILSLHTPYNERFIQDIKRIKGRTWNSLARAWEVPGEAHEQVQTLLKRHYGQTPEPDSRGHIYIARKALVLVLCKALHDVSAEPRIPKGQHGGGEWTKAGQPHPTRPDLPPSTVEQRAEAKARGVIVPPTSWGLEVAADPKAKVQATWYDAKGRKQYGYHPDAVAERDAHKFGALDSFAQKLPAIRKQVQADLQRSDAQRSRVAAAVVALIDATTMRVGSEEYAQENGTYGASSLRKEHVRVEGDTVHVAFTGKHHQEWERNVQNAALAETVQHLLSLPGERVFQYHGSRGEALQPLTETVVRDYLKPFGVIPKQFRTYHATWLATEYLREAGRPADAKQAQANIAQAVKKVAQHLGNTPAVCRSSYINPAVLNAYQEGLLNKQLGFETLHKALTVVAHAAVFNAILRRVRALLASGRITDEASLPLRKAMARRGGAWSGQASYIGQPRAIGQEESDRVAPVLRAAEKVPGLTYASSTFQRVPSLAGPGGHDYLHAHEFHAKDPALASARLMQHLQSAHTVEAGPVYHTSDANGFSMAHHTITATAKDFSGIHHITVSQTPNWGHHVAAIAQQSGPALGGGIKHIGSAARKIAVKLTQGKPKTPKAPNPLSVPDQAQIGPIHQAAAAFKMAHVATQAHAVRRGILRRPTGEKNYSHWFNHKTPQVKARQMRAFFAQQGHAVSNVRQRRVFVGDKIRHQYSFTAQHPSGGPAHTVSVFRP